jgi:hypothetical protein
LRPSPDKLRPARVSLKASYRRFRPKMTWIAWLMLAIVLAAALSPGEISASRLIFQSSPPSLPPTATPLPPPQPTAAPIPPTDTPVPPPPTAVPVEPTQVPASEPTPAPTEAPPVQPQPTQQPPIQPAPTPTAESMQAPTTGLETEPPIATITPLAVRPQPPARQSAPDAPGQPVINWIKFWDTMAVIIAYPWLCCGVSLLLLVPLALLFLEIKGRRPPPMPPEPIPGKKREETKRMEDER